MAIYRTTRAKIKISTEKETEISAAKETEKNTEKGNIAFIIDYIKKRNGIVVWYRDPGQIKAMEIIYQVFNETEMLLNPNDAFQICMAVKRTAKLDGAIAEVGVYRGGSAKLICEAKGNKPLYLFDTFEGLPQLSNFDDSLRFHKQQYVASYESVKEYLRQYPNVQLYKGLFPETAEPIKNLRFSFVNLDLDLYESTRNSLEFFYPRMCRGGIIICHDYPSSSGVKRAIDEFFQDKPEIIIESSGIQCLVVKL